MFVLYHVILWFDIVFKEWNFLFFQFLVVLSRRAFSTSSFAAKEYFFASAERREDCDLNNRSDYSDAIILATIDSPCFLPNKFQAVKQEPFFFF